MKLLLVGATGLVGHEVLTQALANPRIETVVAPALAALPADGSGWLVIATPAKNF